MKRKIAVVGGNGQVGRALRETLLEADFFDRSAIDLAHPSTIDNVDWSCYDTVVNAAAYTAVDKAEVEPDLARTVNGTSVGVLAERVSRHGGTLIHYSTDYVFDGTQELHTELEAPNPKSVYGATKRIGDTMALAVSDTYVIRTSWVVGEGNNFVKIMHHLAKEGVNPPVVNDQFGRLSFTDDIAQFTQHLIETRPEPGIYNYSSEGPVSTWYDIARKVFILAGCDPDRVAGQSTADYFASKPNAADRPKHSTFDLAKTQAAGGTTPDWQEKLVEYVGKLGVS